MNERLISIFRKIIYPSICIYKEPIVFYSKKEEQRINRKEKFFSSSILPKWVHHILSYTVATSFQSLGEQKKKKKKKKNENYEKIGEKEKNRIEMNVYECEMGRYKLCLSGCRANTRGDGVRGIWINKTQSSEKKIVNRRREWKN